MKFKHWTPEDDKKLRQLYPHTYNQDVADWLSLTYSQIYRRAKKLGLEKTSRFLKLKKEDGAKMLIKHGADYRYKKGQKAFNKGKKQTEFMSAEAIERTKSTRFQKGCTPHNTKYNGYERLTKDGYIEARVKQRVFKLKHRLLWERYHGLIPKGYNVVFKDTDKLNITIENLELISDADLMNRNTIHQYPSELRKVIITKNKIEKQLKKNKPNG